MSSLGELHFSLGLDDEKFDKALEAAKQKVEKLGGNVNIGVNFDKEQVAKQLQSLLDPNRKVKLEADISNIEENIRVAKKELEELTKTRSFDTSGIASKQGFIANQAAQLEKLKKELESIQNADRPVAIKVDVEQESINKVKAQLASLGEPITPKVAIEYDQDKFQAVSTTLKNYTERLNELGKVRLGIDDSFLRTDVGSQSGKGLNGILGKVSDYLLGDDTGEVGKSIKSIQKILDNHTFKITGEIDAARLVSSAKKSMPKIPVSVNVDMKEVQKQLKALKVPLDFNVKDAIKEVKAELKKAEFKAKLSFVVSKQEVQETINAVVNNATTSSKKTTSSASKSGRSATKKATSEMNALGNATKNASNWASQLNNQFNNLVSIYSLERFVRNLYTIGGEFQKQQIALRNMIGDVDKGNAIFERMKGSAVKSPFTFSELASYTKQMSAYGIEYENLYDTTKRLADISAGVGIDMGRLILAFGQVRSAAVLRGQELRQFTEAGIPLVAELAKKFSELEGRIVSTGEVFEKISKREVSFGMVKDILFDMTDPGGKFFKTQEELAESLAGKWSNLKDAWDIMIADIAKGNNTVLSGLADIINSLMRGFETWLPFVSGAVVALGLLRGAIAAVNIVASANPWILIGSIIAGVATTVISFAADTETLTERITKLNRELEVFKSEQSDNNNNASRYLDILSKSTEGEADKFALYKKQKAAFEELVNLYPKLMEGLSLEEMTLEKIAEKRKEIADLTKANILSMYDDKIEDAYKEYAKKKKRVDRYLKQTGLSIDYFPEDKAELEGLYNIYINLMNAKEDYEQSLLDKNKPIKLANWQEIAKKMADEYKTKNIFFKDPTAEHDIYAYFDHLAEVFKDAKNKYDSAASEELRRPQKAIMNAANAINMAIGGRNFNYKKINKDAATQAKLDAKAYAEELKRALAEEGQKWNMFKQLFDATGDKVLSMKIAFNDSMEFVSPYMESLKEQLEYEAKKLGVNMSVSDLLNSGEKQLMADKTIPEAERENVAKALGAIIDAYHNENKRLKNETIKDFVDIINSSKDFAAKIESIERDLQKKLYALSKIYGENSPEYKRSAKEATKKAEEEKTKVRFEEFKESTNWVKVFDDLDRVSDATLDNMIVKVEEFSRKAKLSEEVTKQLVDAVRKLKDEKIERNPFSVFSADISEELSNAKKAIDGYKKAIKTAKSEGNSELVLKLEEKKAAQEDKVKDIYKNYDVAMNKALKKVSEFANSVSEVSSMLERFGNEGLKNLSEYLNSISSGMQSGYNAGSIFGVAGGVIGGFVGAATGAMSGLVDAGRKAVQAEQERSQIVIDRLDKVASILNDRIANSLTGLYNSTLDATSRMEMQNLKEKYDYAEKYFVDKGITIKPDSSYIASLNSPTFSWDTEEYLTYSKKTHDAINQALEADNEYMAMYASMLAQRDEMMTQMATYSDKDREDVEQYKRDKKIEIEKLDLEIEQLSKDMMSSLYSVDFSDWSKQFADSIVGAWAKGEDAAKAYENTVSSIMRNVATSMVQQMIIGDYLEKNIKPLVDEFIGKNGVMDEGMFSTLAGIVEGVEEKTEDVQNFLDSLESIMNEKGLTLKDISESSSTSLSKGIQSVTEDTASLLGSYLNAIRQDVSVKRTLLEQLVSVDVPKINYIAEAQLQQLQAIVGNTKRNADAADRIYELVNKVVDKGSNKLKI